MLIYHVDLVDLVVGCVLIGALALYVVFIVVGYAIERAVKAFRARRGK